MLSTDKSQIIVLHLTKYGDSGAVVHCIDSKYGRTGLLLRGISKGRNSSAIAQFHNLNIMDIVSDSNPKSQLRYLKEYENPYRLDNIRGNIYKRTIALFISEVLYRGLHDNLGDERLFEWLVTSIKVLNELNGPIANFHLWWLVGFCSSLGFKPQCCEVSGSHNSENDVTGLFLFTNDELSILSSILDSNMEEVLAMPLSGNARRDFAVTMLKYLSFHLGCEITAKSLPVLHDIFR